MAFRLNPQGVEELVQSPRMSAFLELAGEGLKGEVEQQAERFAHTHHFARSIKRTAVRPDPVGLRVTVYSTDPAAHIIENGSKNNPAYAPLRKAAARFGLRLRGGGERP